MHVSFNGVLAVYTYNCPYAHKLRNIDRIYPKFEEPEEVEGPSKRELGIINHELSAKYILGEVDELSFSTDLIEWAKAAENKIVEVQRFADTGLSPLDEKPSEGDYVSYRMDVAVAEPYSTTVIDLKFGNSEFGAPRYYDEIEFFLALEAGRDPNVGEWEVAIHFPLEDYTLPRRKYGYNQVARLQQKYMGRIDRILSDKFCKPNPSRGRCRFCDYRSEDTGGSGDCEFTVI